MYETVSTASGSSTEEHKAESSKNEVVLKGCAEKTLKNDALTPPARLIPARRMPRYNPAKLSKEIYDLFVSGLKYGEPAYPGTKELRNLGFQTSKGTSHRKRFRKLIHRFELDVVQGSLVYSPNLEEDVILYKRTGKIILHDENLEKVILRAHLWGNNFVNDENKDKAKPCHFDVGATLAELGKDFSISQSQFGIDRSFVSSVIYRCKSCKKGHPSLADECTVKFSTNDFITCAETQFQLSAKALTCGEKDSSLTAIKQLEKSRFPSMVAHVPDHTCIWYDRKSIAQTTNRFEKLVMVLGEMNGDMSLAIRGDKHAKDRFEAKLYCAQLLIKDHMKSIQRDLIYEDSSSAFTSALLDLQQVYKHTGHAGIFIADINDLLTHLRTSKLAMSPLIVNAIEDFVKLLDGQTETGMEEKSR